LIESDTVKLSSVLRVPIEFDTVKYFSERPYAYRDGRIVKLK
jgi:hypothetical protein